MNSMALTSVTISYKWVWLFIPQICAYLQQLFHPITEWNFFPNNRYKMFAIEEKVVWIEQSRVEFKALV